MLISVLDSRACPDILYSEPFPTAIPPTPTYQRPSHSSCHLDPKRNVGTQTGSVPGTRSTSKQRRENGLGSMRNGIWLWTSITGNDRIRIPIC